ncbi:6TM ABC transporter family protein [Neisseria chenwenguii]|uniref:hypothetical protein n=1 Tax=Neisseria chenwenguii TaxID=1853278 RepID=UPI0018DEEFCA|nr:hypothetical protein [Neisseria chenwenguii]
MNKDTIQAACKRLANSVRQSRFGNCFSIKNNAWWKVAYRFKDYIRPERWLIAGSLGALLSSTFIRLLKPLPLAFAVDHILVEVVEHVDKMDGVKEARPAVTDIQFSTSLFDISLGAIDNDYLLMGCAVAVILIALLMAAGNFISTVGLSLAGSRILDKVRSDLFSPARTFHAFPLAGQNRRSDHALGQRRRYAA